MAHLNKALDVSWTYPAYDTYEDATLSKTVYVFAYLRVCACDCAFVRACVHLYTLVTDRVCVSTTETQLTSVVFFCIVDVPTGACRWFRAFARERDPDVRKNNGGLCVARHYLFHYDIFYGE